MPSYLSYNPGTGFTKNDGPGTRIKPGSNPPTEEYHGGTDYPAPAGTKIPAAADGTIHYSGENTTGGAGYTVIIEHTKQDGKTKFYTVYMHMNGVDMPEVGASVKAGDPIGKVGHSGCGGCGNHLHFEIVEGVTPANTKGGPLGYESKIAKNHPDPATLEWPASGVFTGEGITTTQFELGPDGKTVIGQTITTKSLDGNITYTENKDGAGKTLSTDKTVTDADGVQKYHTDYDANGNPTGQENSYTSKDGSVEYYEKRDANGKLQSYDLTETKKDGSKKETHTELNPDGSIKSQGIKETDPNGKVTEGAPYIPPHEPHDPSLYDPPNTSPIGPYPTAPQDKTMDGIDDTLKKAKQQGSPLILDLDNDGIETTAVKAGTYFDHGGDGFAEQTGWVGQDDGLLVLDRNENGQIDTGAELFGNNTLLANGIKAANGFAALAELDTNHDGKVDAQDAAFADLRVWKDSNGDGISATNELLNLAEAGVQAIATGYTTSTLVDAAGNAHKQTGSYTKTDGSTATATDVWFAVDRAHSVATEWLDVPTDIAALPNAKGYGTVYNLHQAMVRDETGVLKSLVGQFVAADTVAERSDLVEKIIYKWAGVDGVISDSRGPYVDARKLASLEVVFAEDFIQREITPNYLSLQHRGLPCVEKLAVGSDGRFAGCV